MGRIKSHPRDTLRRQWTEIELLQRLGDADWKSLRAKWQGERRLNDVDDFYREAKQHFRDLGEQVDDAKALARVACRDAFPPMTPEEKLARKKKNQTDRKVAPITEEQREESPIPTGDPDPWRDFLWAYQNIASKHINPEKAPSGSAIALLNMFRTDGVFFMKMVDKHLSTDRSKQERAGDDDDQKDIEELLDELGAV